MKLAILIVLAGSAAAFAPSPLATYCLTLNMALEDSLGTQPPLGIFAPLGLVANGDEAKFDRLCYTEIKHGRVAMRATVGYRVGKSGLCFPGDIPYDGTKFSAVGGGFDALGMYDVTDDGKFVGDVRNGFIDFGWDTFDKET